MHNWKFLADIHICSGNFVWSLKCTTDPCPFNPFISESFSREVCVLQVAIMDILICWRGKGSPFKSCEGLIPQLAALVSVHVFPNLEGCGIGCTVGATYTISK